jgi:hypothetical protein
MRRWSGAISRPASGERFPNFSFSPSITVGNSETKMISRMTNTASLAWAEAVSASLTAAVNRVAKAAERRQAAVARLRRGLPRSSLTLGL